MNKVILLGNVGKDPESRVFENGGTIVKFSLATSESWKDKEGKQEAGHRVARCCLLWQAGRNHRKVRKGRAKATD